MTRIKTDYVPEHALRYLTPGREYEIVKEAGKTGGWIVGDDGERVLVRYPSCAHLDGHPWEVLDA